MHTCACMYTHTHTHTHTQLKPEEHRSSQRKTPSPLFLHFPQGGRGCLQATAGEVGLDIWLWQDTKIHDTQENSSRQVNNQGLGHSVTSGFIFPVKSL
jgi:hypothetical protein